MISMHSWPQLYEDHAPIYDKGLLAYLGIAGTSQAHPQACEFILSRLCMKRFLLYPQSTGTPPKLSTNSPPPSPSSAHRQGS